MRREWCLYFSRAPATTAVVSLARFGGCLCLCWGAGAFTAQYLVGPTTRPTCSVRWWCNPIEQVASHCGLLTALLTLQTLLYYCSEKYLLLQRPTIGRLPTQWSCWRTCVTGVRIWVQSCVRGAPFFLQRSSLLSTWHLALAYRQPTLFEWNSCLYVPDGESNTWSLDGSANIRAQIVCMCSLCVRWIRDILGHQSWYLIFHCIAWWTFWTRGRRGIFRSNSCS